MYSNVSIIYELSSAQCSITTRFKTSRYCRAKVEFNSINLFRHGSSTAFQTGLSVILKLNLLHLFHFGYGTLLRGISLHWFLVPKLSKMEKSLMKSAPLHLLIINLC